MGPRHFCSRWEFLDSDEDCSMRTTMSLPDFKNYCTVQHFVPVLLGLCQPAADSLSSMKSTLKLSQIQVKSKSSHFSLSELFQIFPHRIYLVCKMKNIWLKILDSRNSTDITHYFVVCGTKMTQMRAQIRTKLGLIVLKQIKIFSPIRFLENLFLFSPKQTPMGVYTPLQTRTKRRTVRRRVS